MKNYILTRSKRKTLIIAYSDEPLKKFWAIIEGVLPNYMEYKKRLRELNRRFLTED